MRPRFGSILMSLLAAVLPAWGQLYFFEADALAAQPPAKPLMADVTATLTAQTPWGPFTQTETGKYWRSRDGKIRQDTAFGVSRVLDLGSNPRTTAQIDYELRRIAVSIGRSYRKAPNKDVTGRDFIIDGRYPKKTGETVLEGFKVTIRKGEFLGEYKGEVRLPRESRLEYEIWTSEVLKIVLLFKLKTESAELVQRYHNIRREEPDPSVFQLPPGFRTVTIYPSSASSSCARREVGISGEKRPIEVDTFLCHP